MDAIADCLFEQTVAPPRGERGLKLPEDIEDVNAAPVAPPRGERGLKPVLGEAVVRCEGRSPSWGAWIETNGTKYA